MTGYAEIQKIDRMRRDIDELGLVFTNAKFRDANHVIALCPKNDGSLPVYSRDAEIFVGSLEELDVWLRGVEWARTYDRLLKVSDDTKRAKKEQDYRNRELADLLRK